VDTDPIIRTAYAYGVATMNSSSDRRKLAIIWAGKTN